ncbi:MAG: peptidylprolyl isomerase [Microbacteriaceae bacterium]|nr:peptidylprolyl isomerase [Microbacteriaceae bacterium]
MTLELTDPTIDLKRGFVRKLPALLAAFAVLAALTSCASSTTVAGCSPQVASGSASSVVKTTGAWGKKPTVKLPTPLFSSKTEVSTVIAGKGPAIQYGQPVTVDATILDGRTGKVLQVTDYTKTGSGLIVAGTNSTPGVSQALVCATAGSRIAVVLSPKDGTNNKADSADGIKAKDSLVWVLDVRKAMLAKANGTPQVSSDAYPSVVTTANGAPGITLPSTPAPKKLTTVTLQQGSGVAVKDGQLIIAKYTAITWTATPNAFDSTWKKNDADAIEVGAASVSPGLSTALKGKRVGSQLMVMVPASLVAPTDGSGTAPSGVPVVYVIDILGIIG